jgi:hypothetical protein
MLTAVAPPITQALDWGLSGRVGITEDGEFLLGMTYTPDKEFPLGIFFQVERLEWEQVDTITRTVLRNGRPPLSFTEVNTIQQDDTKWAAGIEWTWR